MNKYYFDVTVVFLAMPMYSTRVAAINGFQAMQKAIKEHRLETGCGANELYCTKGSKAKRVNWQPVA